MTSLLLRCLQVPDMRAETWCVDGYPENLNGVFWNMLWSELELDPFMFPPPQSEFDGS